MPVMVILFFVAFIFLVMRALTIGARNTQMRQQIAQARVPVERLRREVVDGITYADNYLDLLPASNDATVAKAARQAAAAYLSQAANSARTARSADDLGRAEALLEQARDQVTVCRQRIDVATGGTGFAVAVDGTEYRATPQVTEGTATFRSAPIHTDIHPEDIPEAERGVCFFCSRPARLSELKPVRFVLNGQQRKVLACADDVQTVQGGFAPQVRTVETNGQQVPWYRSTSYSPYRDYTHSTSYAHSSSYGHSGGSVVIVHNDPMDLVLLSMLMTPEPVPYPVFVGADGGYSYDPGPPLSPYEGNMAFGDNGNGMDFSGGQPDGTGDFGGGFDTSGTDFWGGAIGSDGNADFSSTMFGASDSSSSWDTGSTDSGSSSSSCSSSSSSCSSSSCSSSSCSSSSCGGGGCSS